MAAIDKEVRKVIAVDNTTIIKLPIRPTFPTTQPNLRYIITPRMVSKEGVKTPPKVLSLISVPFLKMALKFYDDAKYRIEFIARLNIR
tara:strand:+ start:178072 stop:178335 length:264 start_codon:yes stop_codon:yes gene_type:complete